MGAKLNNEMKKFGKKRRNIFFSSSQHNNTKKRENCISWSHLCGLHWKKIALNRVQRRKSPHIFLSARRDFPTSKFFFLATLFGALIYLFFSLQVSKCCMSSFVSSLCVDARRSFLLVRTRCCWLWLPNFQSRIDVNTDEEAEWERI